MPLYPLRIKPTKKEKRKGSINEGLITEINQINIFFLFSLQFPRVVRKNINL